MKQSFSILAMCAFMAACSQPAEPSAHPADPAAEGARVTSDAPDNVPAEASSAAGTASSRLPLLTMACPDNIAVHADEGGPVYINGTRATITSTERHHVEANEPSSGIMVSIDINADGSPSVSYKGRGGVSGVCTSP